MKKKSILGLVVLLFVACSHVRTTVATNPQELSAHSGRYVGFTPTDESAVMLGEIEATVAADQITIRYATGHEIRTETLSSTELRAMKSADVASIFKDSSPYGLRSIGFETSQKCPRFLFLPDASRDEYGLIIFTSLSDLVGPTVLYNEAQVKRGDFKRALRKIEKEAGRRGVVPRLENDGRAK